MFAIKRVYAAVIAFVLLAAISNAEIVERADVKAKYGVLGHISDRDDLSLERAVLTAKIRQDDAGNCFGNIYLSIKSRAELGTHAKLQMRMRKSANCTISPDSITLEDTAKVNYKITQQGERTIIGISRNGYFDYGVVGTKAPVIHRGEERVSIKIENGKAQVTGQSFGIEDMDVINMDV